MLTGLKSLLKPAFMKGLECWTALRWHRRGRAAGHSLPHPLIVSLTSYPKRYDVLGLTLRTLLTQDTKPDAVVLWIAYADLGALPQSIRAMEADGLTIRGADDLRSYKKIIPALQSYPDAVIVTADDDVYYPADWLRRLTGEFNAERPDVLCHRAHIIRRNDVGLLPYDDWEFNIRGRSASADVFFTGVGGVLYPPKSLHQDVLDIEKLQRLCPTTDDVWLNWMARLNGTAIRKVDGWIRFYEWGGSQGVALQNTNRGSDGGNDVQIANLVAAYSDLRAAT